MKDERLAEAIACGQVEVVTSSAADVHELRARHHRCTTIHVGACKVCQIGIEEYKILVCPFCGRRRDHHPFKTGCTGIINNRYECGTIINICTHHNDRPGSITTVVIGFDCCGPEEDVI